MIKILRRTGNAEGEFAIKYSVTNTATTVTVHVTSEKHKLTSNTISFKLAEHQGVVVEVAAIGGLDGHNLVAYPLYFNNAFGTAMPNRSYDAADERLFRIAFGTDTVIQLLQRSLEIPGYENVVMEDDVSLPKALAEHSDVAASYLNKTVKKSNLLSQLDNGNSIAYLEAQVDVLTRYVLHLHKDNEYIDPELRAVLEAADKHSVLDIKAQDKLIKEMEHKAHTREEQLKYYGS